MGKYTNGKASNILGFAALVLMTVAGVILVYMELTGTQNCTQQGPEAMVADVVI